MSDRLRLFTFFQWVESRVNSKWVLLFFVMLSWCSGLTYVVLDVFFRVQTALGVSKHPLQHSVLSLHGASAFVMLVLYGLYLGIHVAPRLRKGLYTRSGVWNVILIGLLAGSAYGMYYTGNDIFREILEYFHISLGFTLPFFLAGHIYWNRYNKA